MVMILFPVIIRWVCTSIQGIVIGGGGLIKSGFCNMRA